MFVCKECKCEVEMNLDHVGRCDTPGACSGTFNHVIRRESPKRLEKCSRLYKDIQHHQVEVRS